MYRPTVCEMPMDKKPADDRPDVCGLPRPMDPLEPKDLFSPKLRK